MQRRGHTGRAHYKPARRTYVRPPVAVRPYRRRRKRRGASGGGGSPPQHSQLGPSWIRILGFLDFGIFGFGDFFDFGSYRARMQR